MIVGLTGGIASGKSTVSAYLAQKGLPVFDADEISRRVTQKGGPGAQAIAQAFGGDFFAAAGVLDRKKLAGYVFADSARTEKLNGLLHPIIKAELLCRMEESPAPIKILDAPLLMESGLDQLCDKVIAVVCETETRIRRAQARDGLSRREILERISRQTDDSTRRQKADFIIDNTGTLAQTLRQTDAILQKLGGYYGKGNLSFTAAD